MNKGGIMQKAKLAKKGFLGFAVAMIFLCAGCLSAYAGGVSPNQELQDLKAQVKMLTQRIKQIEGKKAPCADTAALEQKVAELEKWKKKRSNFTTEWKQGFRIKYHNPDNNNEYLMRLRAGIQGRYTYAMPDDEIPSHHENYSSVIMRRLRLFVDGYAPNKDWKYFMQIQLEPQSSVNTHDAFVVWRHYKFARVQMGRMKIPYDTEFWQSGFAQNGADRTIFTGDSEYDKDQFGNNTYDIPGGNARLRVGKSLDKYTAFPTGGMQLYRSQGLNLNGDVEMFDQKQFLNYVVGVYNGRDTRGFANPSADMLYVGRLGINFLPGSNPNNPMGSKGFKHYFTQGDYNYQTKPLAAVILGAFQWTSKVENVYDPMGASGSYGNHIKYDHDINNYGGDATFLFRYMGISADLEAAWEEFQQAPDKEKYGHSYNWDRWGGRANLGYFFVPKKWEATFKFAYLKRMDQNNLENSLASGLGVVKVDNGYAVEKDMQQYRFGVNYYLHGFNQYISAEVGWFHRKFDSISQSEADALGFTGPLNSDPDGQDDVRLRVQYQHFF